MLTHTTAWPYIRRIRALLAAGNNPETLATHLNTTTVDLHRMAWNPPLHIHRQLADRIKDHYVAAQMYPISTPTDCWASPHWALPFDWDDIDNPEEKRIRAQQADRHRVVATPEVRRELQRICDTYDKPRRHVHGVDVARLNNSRNPTMEIDSFCHIMNVRPEYIVLAGQKRMARV